MSKPVRLAREARDELHEAARWYADQRSELRVEFLAEIDEAMERASSISHRTSDQRLASTPSSALNVSS